MAGRTSPDRRSRLAGLRHQLSESPRRAATPYRGHAQGLARRVCEQRRFPAAQP